MKKANGLLGVIGQRWGRDLLHGLARDFVGDDIADGLGLDRTAWRFAPQDCLPAINVSSRARALIPAGAAAADEQGTGRSRRVAG